jgi:[ribosomal protein S18]-alanine N-acetyltransferase
MGSSTRPGTAQLTGTVIRPGRAADLASVVELERACYSDPWPATAFAALPDNPRVYFAVADSPVVKSIAGYVVAWYVLDEGELANLAVATAARRQGIGKALLDAAIGESLDRRVSDLYLEVRESNQSARRLYASRGFEEVSRRKGYYRSPVEDALILRRTLKP